MKKLWYIPDTLCCECCGEPFAEGDFIKRNIVMGRSFCMSCKDTSLENVPELRDISDKLNEVYVFIKGRARLHADRDNLRRLHDGCYQIGVTSDNCFYFINPIERMSQKRNLVRDALFLKKKGDSIGVAFTGGIGYDPAHIFDDEEAEYFDTLYELLGDGDIHFLISDANPLGLDRVVGMVNTELNRLYNGFFVTGIRFPVMTCSIQSKDRMLGRYEDNHCDRKLASLLRKLTPKVMLDFVRERIIGQETALKSAVYFVYRYLRSISLGKEFTAENWMITAPSGAGKTEFFRAVRDMFKKYGINIPVAQIDLSQITESGFKGNNCDTIVKRLAGMNKRLGGYAVCFLDEADKKFAPSYGSGGTNVNAAVQSNLLTLIEGIEQKVEVGDETVTFDTGKTMFVFMGAFQEIRDRKLKKRLARGMGFGSEFEKKDTTASADEVFYDKIDQQDMIEYGMLEEIAGRIVRVVNFGALTEEDMQKLVRSKTELIGEEYSCEIFITDKAVKGIAAMSYGTIGIRKPINHIKLLVQDALMEAEYGSGFNSRTDVVLIESENKARVCKRYELKRLRRKEHEAENES